ncbi:MAG: type II toxin-antitoxin system VapC family toxin [Roseiarcus sp.]
MIVVDASALLEVLLRTPAAAAIEKEFYAFGAELHAPHLIDLEIAQVLRRYVLRRMIDAQTAEAALDDLEFLPMLRHAHSPLIGRAWALRQNLTIYDGVYVALAEFLGATLLTHDGRLANAAGIRAKVRAL